MTSPIQPDKTYGVLHTESFFSFLGFAKKVGSDEIQKIDVFLDNKLIDTIEANEFIQKIDDMYDIENKAFTYNLQTQYMGKKAIISFKNHDSGEELLNSPYTLIDKNHEKFNEAKFIQSLNEPISEELKNMYKPNCIGFLATKENMEDEEFVNFIILIAEYFVDTKINCFYFSKDTEMTIPFKNLTKISFLPIDSITQMIKNMEIYIHNMDTKRNNIRDIMMFETNEIFCVSFSKKTINLTLEEHSRLSMKPGFPYYDNPSYFGFSDEDIKNSNGNMHALLHSNIFGNNSKLDLKQTLKEVNLLYLSNVLKMKKYKEYVKILNKNFKKYEDKICT